MSEKRDSRSDIGFFSVFFFLKVSFVYVDFYSSDVTAYRDGYVFLFFFSDDGEFQFYRCYVVYFYATILVKRTNFVKAPVCVHAGALGYNDMAFCIYRIRNESIEKF